MLLARPASALLALGVLALGGCGDAARDGDFVGAPIATVTSEVEVGLAADRLAPLRVTLAWSREDGVGGFVAARAGDVAIDTSAPGTIAVTLLEAPAADVARHDAGVVKGLALGQLIAYVDSDGDGRFGAADRIVGIDSSVLVYSDGAASAPTLGSFGSGLHRMLAAPCAGPASPRFDGPLAAAAGSLYIGTKWESGLFAVACPALRGACDDLEGLRAVCWDDPTPRPARPAPAACGPPARRRPSARRGAPPASRPMRRWSAPPRPTTAWRETRPATRSAAATKSTPSAWRRAAPTRPCAR
ncbi:MAG: hypothetical protein U1F43_04575 [Myxococcota bacterium]